ncbi:MAG: hypothetical protein EA350_01230 [Gemmatimonadales bacterium]|nr:MAG: hypothetical protein EA350_01230 [Gemmatimonadales bacterium]
MIDSKCAGGDEVRMKLGVGLAAVVMLFVFSAPAQGQVAWESPILVSPSTPAGWGVYLVDPHPGSGIGVLSTFRGSDGPGVGYRVGLGEDRSGSLAVSGGVDISGMFLRQSPDFPLDVIWVSGLGVSIGDRALISAPFGVSLGRALETDGVWFNPYVAPRVVLDASFGSGSDLQLGVAVDLGIDVSFEPGWAIRFGGTLGDRSALAIGMSFRVF